jgi:uncharacterized membrane protein YoaK (UPF0700 family)
MTSGNYRKMITAWHNYLTTENKTAKMKRQAVNYSLVVVSFVLGAIFVAIIHHFIQVRTIWIVSLILLAIIYHYTSVVIRYRLQTANI